MTLHTVIALVMFKKGELLCNSKLRNYVRKNQSLGGTQDRTPSFLGIGRHLSVSAAGACWRLQYEGALPSGCLCLSLW